ncbi:MAG TPA: ATP synthase subunit I [Candidatus Brocadiales bacterium]|nr:ATP synthase subunit I [Candidatus Brocadiales bacterium]
MIGSRETKTGMLVLDEGFPKRVFNTSLLLMAMIALCSTSFRSFEISYSVLIGCAISLGLCKLQWWAVQQFFQRGKQSGKQFFAFINLLKYFVLCVIFYIMFSYLQVHVIAFLVGISLVPAVISLKMLGMLFMNYLNSSQGSQTKGVRN